MPFAFRRRIRHPLYPALSPTSAVDAKSPTAALTGTFAELSNAAVAGTHVERAVFSLHTPTNPFLTSRERDFLWTRFEVPVLALLVDQRRTVIGYECEVQQGFHLDPDYAGGLLFGRVESSLCECGRPGPRLMPEEEEGEEGVGHQVSGVGTET